jgi:predicted acetyltransferase
MGCGVARWLDVSTSTTLAPLVLRSPTDADWEQTSLLHGVSFGHFEHADTYDVARSLIADDGAVVVCDDDAVVGMAAYFDFAFTVPGGAVVPMAGLSMVGVAPTHRRRGVLRAMYVELHQRIADAAYPLAGLTASEGGIYGRFGYGPATMERVLTIDRRFAKFHADAPDPGGARMIRPAEHGDALAAIYDRWRRQTPGGLVRSQGLWDDLLADREDDRDGGTALVGILHADGYVLYRVFGSATLKVRVEEFKAVTTDAHVALTRALLGLDLVETVKIWTYARDPLPYLLTDSRVARTTKYEDDLWLRIMDVPTALEARGYQADMSTVIEVSDQFAGSGGRFALDVRDGRARCTPTDAAPQVWMDLDVLGSLYLGVHQVVPLATANRVRANDPTVLARLEAAFLSDVPAHLGFGF